VMVYERVVELMAERDPKRVMRVAGRILDRLDHVTLSRIRQAVAPDEHETTTADDDAGDGVEAADEMSLEPARAGTGRED
jgi:hypothetical protein